MRYLAVILLALVTQACGQAPTNTASAVSMNQAGVQSEYTLTAEAVNGDVTFDFEYSGTPDISLQSALGMNTGTKYNAPISGHPIVQVVSGSGTLELTLYRNGEAVESVQLDGESSVYDFGVLS